MLTLGKNKSHHNHIRYNSVYKKAYFIAADAGTFSLTFCILCDDADV